LLENLIPNQIISPDLQVYLDEFRNYIQNLSQKAAEYDVPLLIDAEDSWYQHLVDEITEEMMSKYNQKRAIVFNTLQMYRHDRLLYLKNLHQKAQEMDFIAGLKFVRGAYMEKERIRAEEMIYPSPIQPDKASTDRDFNEALKYCTRNITRFVIFCGTHNEDSCQLLVSLMEENNFEPADKRFWFSQLYGMSDHISFNLASKGYNVAKYIPYGPVKFVMPYLLRRAEENTSVAGQTSRELSLIQRERMRRSQK
jgi:proline dehydrogenase